MLKAKDILKQARYTLSDTAIERWSDDRLLALLDEGIKVIASSTVLMVEYFYVPIADNVVDYDFSPLVSKIIRVEYLDKPIKMVTFEEMDRDYKDWQHKEGDTPEVVIYNNQKRGRIKLFPIIRNAYNPYITYNSPFGVVTDITYGDILPVVANHIGDIAGIPASGMLKVYHIRKHADLTDVNQELFIDELCKQPLEHYVAGRALRDNQDTQNREMGAEELNFFTALVEQFKLEKEENYSRATLTTNYNPLGV